MIDRTLSTLSHAACMLEGLDVLFHEANGDPKDPTVKMAGNLRIPMIEILIAKAWELQEGIDLARIQRKAA